MASGEFRAATGSHRVFVAALCSAVMGIPMSEILQCDRGWPRTVMLSYISPESSCVRLCLAWRGRMRLGGGALGDAGLWCGETDKDCAVYTALGAINSGSEL